jgi:hypothetical protein
VVLNPGYRGGTIGWAFLGIVLSQASTSYVVWLVDCDRGCYLLGLTTAHEMGKIDVGSFFDTER